MNAKAENNVTRLPRFSEVDPATLEGQLDARLADYQGALQALLQQPDPDWGSLIAPMERLDDDLSQFWSPVRHLNAVLNSEALRSAYNASLPKLSAHYTDLGQNAELHSAIRSIRECEAFAALDEAQRRTIDNALRDFRLSGIDLPADKQARYKEIALRLSELKSRFSDNVLDATQAWTHRVSDAAPLAGLPDAALAMAQQAAAQRDLDGYLLTLDFPAYHAVMTYAEDRELRRQMYLAFNTRASDQGPHAGRWDNSALIEEILALRHEKAQLLGFADYAELSCETKMVENPRQVIEFLDQLVRHSRPQAQREFDALAAFSAAQGGPNELAAWDVAYWSEKQKQQLHDIAATELKPYFPAAGVISGLFEVVARLFGLQIRPLEGIDTWHEDVGFYEVRDADGGLRGHFYLDLYARANKRGGAWMDECVSRLRRPEGLQYPVAYLTCNLTPPAGALPALLTHDEVTTLFHEFGHGLHHLLTQVDCRAVSGISGVEWDAVELPSQFLENWCWEREALDLIAGHYETGEPIPEELLERARAARNFQSAMLMVRQLEFALFDMRLHHEYDPAHPRSAQAVLDEVREQVAVIPPPVENRFQNGFSHIFAGGYAAGYFSYKWAEVLSADAYSRFEEEGIFNRATGEDFLHAVLERGGTRPALESFVDFRGRAPQIDALLRHSGLSGD